MIGKKREIPDIFLERYILGESELEERNFIHQEISANPDVEKRYQEMIVANQNFSDKFDRNIDLENIKNKAKQTDVKVKEVRYSKLAFAFSAVLITVVATPLLMKQDDLHSAVEVIQDETIRLKGITPSISIYRKQDNETELLSQHSQVNANDQLQIRYQHTGYQYGVIFSIDGRGMVTLHFPDQKNSSSKFESDNSADLPYSYQLDDAPDFERFFFIAANHPLNIQKIINRGSELADDMDNVKNGKLKFDNDVYQTSVLLTKVE